MSGLAVPAGLRNPSGFIPQLESLRGWAILLVIVFHYYGILIGDGVFPAQEDTSLGVLISRAGNTGVTLFFVLSGFLLTLPFVRAIRGGKHISIRRFYSARLLRIIPLYYAAILVAWLSTENSTSALKALLFIPVGFEIYPFSVSWWSLCTEVQFYLLLPWLMLALHPPRGRWLVGAGVSAWLILHCIHLLQPQWLGLPAGSKSSLFGRGVAFLLGGLASWFYISRGYAKVASSSRMVGWLALFLLGVLIWLLQWYGLMGQQAARLAMPFYHDLEALIWTGLLLCSLGPLTLAWRIFFNPLASHFGTISYSLYLVHFPVQFYLIYPVKVAVGDTGTLTDIRILAAVAGSFLLSWLLAVLCYHCIEKPFLRLKSHLPVFTGKHREAPAKA